jgi:hypothetical protein
MKSAAKLALTVACAATALGPVAASAQQYGSSYDRRSYEEQRRDYERRQREYEEERQRYDQQYNGYRNEDRRYDNRHDTYERDRAYNDGRYDQRTNCDRSGNAVAGGVLGALAGAALGSAVAGRGAKTEGSVLGGVLGAAVGANVGRNAARCDEQGYYYSYDQTREYREPAEFRGRRSGRYDYAYYSRQRCRLAPAPVYYGGREEYRYVRVCPDRYGRYRIAD